MIRMVFVVIMATSLCGGVANSATINSRPIKDGKILIALSGEIVEGDADSLKATIKKENDAGHFIASIRLNSPGGVVLEGVKIADIVRYGKMATAVGSESKCASACFIVFAAGNEKYANYSASIGVHGASDPSGNETMQSGAATVSMARIVKELGVPSGIIGKMVVTPPSEIVWLTPDDLRSMGVVMVGKPSQLPSTGGEASQRPSQIDPSSRANTSQTKHNPTWNDLAARAIELSSQQNKGVPQYSRTCQPEYKVCNMGVFFKTPDGTASSLRVEEDLNGKVTQREICEFNSFADIRFCTDWDTGVSHRDMKDGTGNWQKVSDE